MLKSQSKIKELTRELRNKAEESDEYKRKVDTLKNERRRGEKTITEVMLKFVWFINAKHSRNGTLTEGVDQDAECSI